MAGQSARLLIQLIGIVVLARMLEPSEFGLVGMVTAITAVASLLGDFGFSNAVMQAKTLNDDQRSNLFWINAIVGVLAGGMVFLLSQPIATFYGDERVEDVIRILSLTFVLHALTTQYMANTARALRFGRLVVVEVGGVLLALVVAVAMAFAGAGYWAIVAQQLVFPVTKLLGLVALNPWKPGLPNRRAPMRALIGYGSNTFAVQIVTYVSSNVDSILIGRWHGPATLGLYDRAFQLYRLPMQQVAAPLSRVAVPVLSRLQDDMQRMNRYLQSAQLGLFYVVGAGLTFAAVAGEPLVVFALGGKWSAVGDLLAIMAVGGFFQIAGYVYYWAFLATGKTGLQLRFVIGTRLAMVALIVAAVPFGVEAVAVAGSLGLMVNWAVLTALPVRRIGVDVSALLRTARRPMLMHLVSGGLVWGSVIVAERDNQPAGLVVVYAAASALMVYICAFLLIPGVRNDLFQVKRLVARKV